MIGRPREARPLNWSRMILIPSDLKANQTIIQKWITIPLIFSNHIMKKEKVRMKSPTISVTNRRTNALQGVASR